MKLIYFLFTSCFLFLISCQSQLDDLYSINELSSNQDVKSLNYKVTEDVTISDINNILQSLFGNTTKSRSNHYDISLLKDEAGSDRIICVNYKNNDGFALISSEKTHTPILAFSKEGNFTIHQDIPSPLEEWLRCTMQDIADSKNLPEDSLSVITNIWNKYKNSDNLLSRAYEPLPDHSRLVNITEEEYYALSQIMMGQINKWNSEGYSVYTIDDYFSLISDNEKSNLMNSINSTIFPLYNDDYWAITVVRTKDYSSEKGEGHCFGAAWTQLLTFNTSFEETTDNDTGHIPVGCTPLAIGQVMHYFRHPNYYDWYGMPNFYGTTTTSDFLLDIFNRSGTKYGEYNGEYGSGTNFNIVPNVLESYGYSSSLIKSSSITSSILEKSGISIISSVLDNNKTGHTWVIEGHKCYNSYTDVEVWTFRDPNDFSCISKEANDNVTNLFFYANWGWGNASNAYYRFNNFIPSNHYKNVIEQAIINITHS